MNFVFAFFLWAITPLIVVIFGEIVRDYDAIEIYFSINPFIQIIVITVSTVGRHIMRNGSAYLDWPLGHLSFNTTFRIFIFTFLGYMVLAIIFLWRTKKRIRNKIF